MQVPKARDPRALSKLTKGIVGHRPADEYEIAMRRARARGRRAKRRYADG